MGPKGAPSYFQQQMCTLVLAGLIQNGLHFSQEKLDKVLHFDKPTTHKQLKTFLGLISYFREHVNNHSELVHELQQMITPYLKYRKLLWSDCATHAFEHAKLTVANCPKLFFINENAPIVLCTDAYGIGAYLYQIVDDKEQPIRFLSKTLDSTQRKWSTIEKEAYAIYYALHKFDYLIRDSHFLLKTDHANLTFINTNSKQKVQRWKLAIQEYDFDIEHIQGSANVAADALSRLCEPDDIGVDENFILPMDERQSIPQQYYKKISKVHNSQVGHAGFDKTMQRLNNLKETWPDRAMHVKQFLRQCPCCQKMTFLKTPIATSPFTLASYGIMDRINVDTIGPLPANEFGQKYIIAIVDCFSRFIELYPATDTTAVSAAKAITVFTVSIGMGIFFQKNI